MKTMKASVLLLLAALPVLLFGCATPQPHMMATPLIFQDERLDFISQVPAERRTTKVPIFYATTRQQVPAGEPGHYSNKPGEEGVQLGIAEVALGEPGWTFDDLMASDRTSSAGKPRPGRTEVLDGLPSGARVHGPYRIGDVPLLPQEGMVRLEAVCRRGSCSRQRCHAGNDLRRGT